VPPWLQPRNHPIPPLIRQQKTAWFLWQTSALLLE